MDAIKLYTLPAYTIKSSAAAHFQPHLYLSLSIKQLMV